jgi:hypothetical protein
MHSVTGRQLVGRRREEVEVTTRVTSVAGRQTEGMEAESSVEVWRLVVKRTPLQWWPGREALNLIVLIRGSGVESFCGEMGRVLSVSRCRTALLLVPRPGPARCSSLGLARARVWGSNAPGSQPHSACSSAASASRSRSDQRQLMRSSSESLLMRTVGDASLADMTNGAGG